MMPEDKETVTEEEHDREDYSLASPNATSSNSSKLIKFYELAQSTKSVINSKIYAATGIKFNQKKLILSFIITLIKDFALAYTVRGSLKLVPKLLKILQSLRVDLWQLIKESFGAESVKFGLFVSLFFSSYKTSEKIINHWKCPGSSLIAGAIASLSFVVMSGEEASFRWTLAEYVAIRAIQCLYNHFIRLLPQFKPFTYYGDVLLFSLSSAQLMYGYFVRPGSLDPEYRGFLEKLISTDKRIIEVNRQFLRQDSKVLTGSNLLNLALLLEDVHQISPQNLPSEISIPLIDNSKIISSLPCSAFHFNEACPERIFNIWSLIFKKSFPMYFSLHLIPKLLFKNKISRPIEELFHTLKNTLQSSSFLASSGALFQSLLCTVRLGNIPDWKYYYWLIGLIAGLGILIEKKPRRSELALYVLPKALQAIYRIMLNRNLMIKIPRGEYLLFSISISILMNYYRKEPESMTPLVSKIFKRFLQ